LLPPSRYASHMHLMFATAPPELLSGVWRAPLVQGKFCRCSSLYSQTVPAGLKEMWLVQMIVLNANDHGEGGPLLKPPSPLCKQTSLPLPTRCRGNIATHLTFACRPPCPPHQCAKGSMHYLTTNCRSMQHERKQAMQDGPLPYTLPAPRVPPSMYR
jgi:hypothetical protein